MTIETDAKKKKKKKKNETGEKIPYLFRISWKFPSKSWSNLLDCPFGSFNQVVNNFLAFPSLFLQCTFWPVSIKAEFGDRPLAWKPCLVLLDEFVNLGCKEHHLSCIHRVSWSKYGVNSWSFMILQFFLQFLYFSMKFLFQSFLKISQNLLVFWKTLWQHVL